MGSLALCVKLGTVLRCTVVVGQKTLPCSENLSVFAPKSDVKTTFRRSPN